VFLLSLFFTQEGQDELFSRTHPDPYRVNYMPGGTKFMRNPPPPIEACFNLDEGEKLPHDAPTYTVNPDFSWAIPENGRSATGMVLVDFAKKNME
jgi:hypothetical protein